MEELSAPWWLPHPPIVSCFSSQHCFKYAVSIVIMYSHKVFVDGDDLVTPAIFRTLQFLLHTFSTSERAWRVYNKMCHLSDPRDILGAENEH